MPRVRDRTYHRGRPVIYPLIRCEGGREECGAGSIRAYRAYRAVTSAVKVTEGRALSTWKMAVSYDLEGHFCVCSSRSYIPSVPLTAAIPAFGIFRSDHGGGARPARQGVGHRRRRCRPRSCRNCQEPGCHCPVRLTKAAGQDFCSWFATRYGSLAWITWCGLV